MKLDQYQYQLEEQIKKGVNELMLDESITVEMLMDRTAEFFEIRVSDLKCRWRFPAYVFGLCIKQRFAVQYVNS